MTFKDASEDVGITLIGSKIKTVRSVFKVGNKTISFNDAHKTNLNKLFLVD